MQLRCVGESKKKIRRVIKANGTCILLIAQPSTQLGSDRKAFGVSLKSAHYHPAADCLSVLFIRLRPWVGAVPRVLIGKWSDRNPASDSHFPPLCL